MGKIKELTKNTIILLVGTFFTKILQYFLLPIYTGYLTTTEYGYIDLFYTIISLLIPIIGLQIEQGVFRYLINNRNNIHEKEKYISSSFFFLMIASFVSFIVLFVVLLFINNNYKWIILANLYLSLFSGYLMQISRGLGDNKTFSISGVITSFFTIIFNIFFLVSIHLKIDGMLYGSLIGYIIGNLYLLAKLKIIKYLSIKHIDKNALRTMMSYSLPMIPNSISWWIFSSSDRFVISYFISVSATGLLSIAYKFSNIGVIIYNVFNMSLTESVSLYIDEEDVEDYFNKVFNSIGQLFFVVGTLIIIGMPCAFKLLINSNFADAYHLIPIAIVATEFQVLSGMLGTIYVAKNNTKSIAITSIISALTNIVIDILLVNFIGIYAAVISTLLSYLILFIYRIKEVNKKYFKIIIKKELYQSFIIINLCSFMFYYINSYCLKFSSLTIIIFLLIIILKNNFRHIFDVIKRKRF